MIGKWKVGLTRVVSVVYPSVVDGERRRLQSGALVAPAAVRAPRSVEAAPANRAKRMRVVSMPL